MELKYRGTTKYIIDKEEPINIIDYNNKHKYGNIHFKKWFGGINEYEQYDIFSVLNNDGINKEVEMTLSELSSNYELFNLWRGCINPKQK
jgi:hypothetical protein